MYREIMAGNVREETTKGMRDFEVGTEKGDFKENNHTNTKTALCVSRLHTRIQIAHPTYS